MKLFKKILVANRGEIACRIIRTAHELDIQVVAVLSEADQNALHVKMADEAHLIGPAASRDSYLNINKIMAIAKLAKVEAIHPGYGFLSENAKFADACEKAGVIFIGPTAKAIALMANKTIAKETVSKAGVPVLPDFFSENQTKEVFLEQAKKIGFPLVLKAVAGGGGKGLRQVHDIAEFDHAYDAVKREAEAYFGDDQLLLEKYLSDARHVEVQILADTFGNVKTLSTRDCSIQRRHQKIIEEAPAPHVSLTLHNKILETAIKVAETIQYTNAGTVEFLLSGNEFYFLEMNTRLQVEHPVTEMITGHDIVALQLQIAAGGSIETLSTETNGHAIEVRLNAEDPENNFLPSSGVLEFIQWPKLSEHFRIDRGYEQNDTVNIYYDSLLAKFIAWDKTREGAIQLLKKALFDTTLFGIKTNQPLLEKIIQDTRFINGQINTHFLQDSLTFLPSQSTTTVFAIATVYLYHSSLLESSSPWQRDGWRLHSLPRRVYHFSDLPTPVTIVHSTDNDKVTLGEDVINISLQSQLPLSPLDHIAFLVDGQIINAKIYSKQNQLEIDFHHQRFKLTLSQVESRTHSHELIGQLLAPMPGTVVALLVSSGQKVNKGDKLLVLEAMKMEHTLYAPSEGIVKRCHYQVGDLISEGAELLDFEPADL